MTTRVQIAAALTAATLGLAVASAMAAPAPKPDDPSTLLASVKQGASAKIGPWLDNLYQEYRAARAKGVSDAQFRTSDRALRVTAGQISIDALATNGAALKRSLQAMGATHVQRVGSLLSARVPVGALGRLAGDAALAYARPAMARTNALPPLAVSQGDISLRADIARETEGVDGTGVTVGLLSDSFECNPPPFVAGAPTSTKQQDINTGELPTEVNVLKNGDCPAADEGRGMAQLVHDVAPGAAIAFHTAFESELDFANGIERLKHDAGANVIADDVIWFAEPMFSDGMIAQAVDKVNGEGVPYFSSAGNQARQSYESAFRGVNVTVNVAGNLQGARLVTRRFHDFDDGPGVQVLQPVRITPDAEAGFVVFSFQWDQPHKRSTTYAWEKAGKSGEEAAQLAKGAQSDLDLVAYDEKGHLLPRCPPGVSRGITCQYAGERNVGGDAVDVVGIYYSGPPKTPREFYIGFVVSAGPDPGVVKYVWFDYAGTFEPLDFHTASGTAWGHANAAGANSVGAASFYATVPFSTSGNYPPNDTYKTPPIAPSLAQCDPGCLNDFSSAGHIPIYLDKFGNVLDTADIRQNPAFTGPDGGNTSFFYSDTSFDDDDGDGLNSPANTFVTPLDQPADEYPNFFGTSASAPHVAAVAALMLQKKPTLTPDQVREALQDTARPIDKRFTSARPIETDPIHPFDGYNFDAGTGLVDAAAAMQSLP